MTDKRRERDRSVGFDKLSSLPWGSASVHLLTATGVVMALLATRALLQGAWEEAFAWLGVAMVIDGVDGPLARRLQVTQRLPRFSGQRLDLIIDYLTYVFIPVLMLLQAGFLTGITGVLLASAILLSSLYHFSDTGSKSDDNYFVGFPAAWNIIVFYVFALALSEPWASVLVLLFVVLTFIPIKWVHPVRVVRFRPLTLALGLLWLVTVLWSLYHGLPAAPWQQIVFALMALYTIILALARGLHHQ